MAVQILGDARPLQPTAERPKDGDYFQIAFENRRDEERSPALEADVTVDTDE